MNETIFWDMIQRVHLAAKEDMDTKCQLIKDAISRLDPRDAEIFAELFDAMEDLAYSWPLWGAAYVIHGGCSDDSFWDFRSSLISRGKAQYDKALKEPDSLADQDIDDDVWCYEGYRYAVSDGVKAATGKMIKRKVPRPKEPSGEPWNEDKVYDLYPRLAAKYG